jgi:acid phosphatase class B
MKDHTNITTTRKTSISTKSKENMAAYIVSSKTFYRNRTNNTGQSKNYLSRCFVNTGMNQKWTKTSIKHHYINRKDNIIQSNIKYPSTIQKAS